MPIYVYKCQECSTYHEALQKVSDPLLTTCPACQKEALTKVIAPVGVIFKGTGFHKNDYSSQSKSTGTAAKPSSGESSSTTTEGASPSTSSDSSTPAASTGSSDSGGGSGSGDKVA